MTTFGELGLGDHFQFGDRVYVKTDNGCCRDVATRQTVRGIGEHTLVERSLEEHGWHISAWYLHLIFGGETIVRASLPMSEWRQAVDLLEKIANRMHEPGFDMAKAEDHILAGRLIELADKLREATGMQSRGER